MLDLENTVKINIYWNSLESIEQAEKDKVELENKGYTLINNIGGMAESTLVYVKEV